MSDPHKPLLNLSDKISIKRKDKHVAIPNLIICYTWKNMKNRITFKIKTGYYLEFLIAETVKLLGSTKSKITKDENGENVPHLEITEVMLVQCNIVNNDY